MKAMCVPVQMKLLLWLKFSVISAVEKNREAADTFSALSFWKHMLKSK